MEYCGGGSLQDIYHGNHKRIQSNAFIILNFCIFTIFSTCTCTFISVSNSNRALVGIPDCVYVPGNTAGMCTTSNLLQKKIVKDYSANMVYVFISGCLLSP